MKAVLEQMGMQCMWSGDLANKIVFVSGKVYSAQVAPETIRPDFLVVLARNGGEEMFLKTAYHIRRKIKTLVLTDDKMSNVCKELGRSIETVYLYETDNPMELNLIGWAGLLREIKLIECRDIVFTEERNMKKIVLVITILVVLFILLPFILALVAAVVLMCCCGIDVGQLIECCCCICNCFCNCSAWCVDLCINIPCCFWCCLNFDLLGDEPYPRKEEEVEVTQVIQTTTVVQPQGFEA